MKNRARRLLPPLLMAPLLVTVLLLTMLGRAQAQGTCDATYSITSGDNGSALVTVIGNATPGHTICIVPDGGNDTITLASQIVIDKSLTISGTGAENVIISGNNVTRIFDIRTGVDVILKGMMLRNGSAVLGGAILLDSNSALTIEKMKLVENVASEGGGALYTSGILTMTDIAFADNQAGGFGGAVVYTSTTTAPLIGSNLAFTNNVALGETGPLAGNWNLVDNVAGGGALWTNSPFTLTNSTFFSNSVEHRGGAILANFTSGDIALTNVEFDRNVSSKSGGALFAKTSGNILIDSSRFTGNQVVFEADYTPIGWRGGAIESNSSDVNSTLVITGTHFISNTATGHGGAIYTNGSMVVTNTHFIVNRTTSLRGMNGGAVAVDKSFVGENVLFQENYTTYGAGALMQYDGPMTLRRSEFISNTAAHQGGAIWAWGPTLTIEDSRFISNTAQGAPSYFNGGGGALYNGGTNVTISDTVFIANSATGHGGAIRNQWINNAPLVLAESTLSTRQAVMVALFGVGHQWRSVPPQS